MIPVLNSFNIQAAVYGNHDFGEPLFTVELPLIRAVQLSMLCKHCLLPFLVKIKESTGSKSRALLTSCPAVRLCASVLQTLVWSIWSGWLGRQSFLG